MKKLLTGLLAIYACYSTSVLAYNSDECDQEFIVDNTNTSTLIKFSTYTAIQGFSAYSWPDSDYIEPRTRTDICLNGEKTQRIRFEYFNTKAGAFELMNNCPNGPFSGDSLHVKIKQIPGKDMPLCVIN